MKRETLNKINILLTWVRVSDGHNSAACHVKTYKLSKAVRKQLKGPQVYRWLISNSQQQIVSAYIGETGRFEGRLALYRNGHKKPKDTVNYIKEQFEEATKRGEKNELQLLSFEPFLLNGFRVETSQLTDSAVRKLLENVALLEAKVQKIKTLNRDKHAVCEPTVELFTALSKPGRFDVPTNWKFEPKISEFEIDAS